MKDEMLNSIKAVYLEKRSLKNDVSHLYAKVKMLEENEYVKEYFKLKEELESFHYEKMIAETDLDLLANSFRPYLYANKETNGIYLYMGAYKRNFSCDIEHGANDYRLRRNDPEVEYCMYKDIETEVYDYIQVPIEKCDEFEDTHKVIIPKTIFNDVLYYEIQREFFSIAIYEGQEVACRKILSKKY